MSAPMRFRRLYLSGPISGYDLAERRGLFGVTSQLLISRGFAVVNPLDVRPNNCPLNMACADDPTGHVWECWLRHDLIEMLRCDEVATLPDCHKSRGSRLEVSTARALSMPVNSADYYLGRSVA